MGVPPNSGGALTALTVAAPVTLLVEGTLPLGLGRVQGPRHDCNSLKQALPRRSRWFVGWVELLRNPSSIAGNEMGFARAQPILRAAASTHRQLRSPWRGAARLRRWSRACRNTRSRRDP